ncbi:MAG TPA: hypothetical protein PKH77_21375 [Anaerolineae bacterium]|nr:hypothetical protein [Anaerolineae bacterium]
MQEFSRRIYRNLPEVGADLRAILARRAQMKPLLRGTLISAAFRERLMLVVTGSTPAATARMCIPWACQHRS